MWPTIHTVLDEVLHQILCQGEHSRNRVAGLVYHSLLMLLYYMCIYNLYIWCIYIYNYIYVYIIGSPVVDFHLPNPCCIESLDKENRHGNADDGDLQIDNDHSA